MIDLQTTKPEQNLEITKVGIKNIKHPITLVDSGKSQNLVGNFSIYVNLDSSQRGTHMSRFIEILNEQKWILSIPAVTEMLQVVRHRFDAQCAYLDISCDYFLTKYAPISNRQQLVDYKLEFSGEINDNNEFITLKVVVPVTTLCPCSKHISEYGAHNQRGEVTVQLTTNQNISIKSIIEIVEKHASCQIYSLLKREDEKYVTEFAYNNPVFVEDLVRKVATDIEKLTHARKYKVGCENFESIHNHSAYAAIIND